MKIAIVGAGAAGYFTAVNLKELASGVEVVIFEASSRSLSKVVVSGGGRCNLTNSFEAVGKLSEVYPRGYNLLKKAFKIFDYKDAFEWFEQRGVELVTQDDECVFPRSQDSQQVVDTFVQLAENYDVMVKHSHKVQSIVSQEDGMYKLSFEDAKLKDQLFDAVVVTSGGSPKVEGLNMLKNFDLSIENPVPSLFTFNIPNNTITELMGAVAPCAKLSLASSKFSSVGVVLITHWGLSGPAVLRLSSYAARELEQREYNSMLKVSWVGAVTPEAVLSELKSIIASNGAKLVTSVRAFDLPARLWAELLTKSGISLERRFAELGSKGLNKLTNTLTNDEFRIEGQSRFREEFVTCGGVSLSEVDAQSLESKKYPNLYFAGEVLDIDGVTGGFNLQSAWTTAYCVARSLAEKMHEKN